MNGDSVCGSCAQPNLRTFLAFCACACPVQRSSAASVATTNLALMVVLSRQPTTGGDLPDVLTYLIDRGGKQLLALVRGGHSRVADHAAAAEARPVRPDLERPVGPVEPDVLGVPVGDLADGLVHLHEARLQRQVDRRLELARVGHPAGPLGVADVGDHALALRAL